LSIDTSNLGTQNQSLIGYFLGPELFVGPRAYQMIENCSSTSPQGTYE